MRTADWIVLCSAILLVIIVSVRKSRGSATMRDFVQSGRDARWYTVALSVMATQASAITFISLPGQAYVDGMRFAQFYFGLPLAMVVLCATALPIYRRLNVLTVYEYLEKRFDLKTRALAAFLFLIQRSLAAGFTVYAPSLVLSVILGWDVGLTILAIGALVATYTTFGGTKAVSWAQTYQMGIIMFGMAGAFAVVAASLPVSFSDALALAGANGKLNAIDFSFDLNNRYTVWSGLLGGLFLQLSYFGTDQSQAQRYLTGQSLTQSRLGLIFNGLFKIPMQVGILLLGALVFAFYQFTAPPLFFNGSAIKALQGTSYEARYKALEQEYDTKAARREQAARAYLEARRASNAAAEASARQALAEAAAETASARAEAAAILKEHNPAASANDTNYIFLRFVIQYLPAGLVGLVIAAVLSASMSSASSEMNALASTTIVDVYKRLVKPDADERHYLFATRLATLAWGAAIVLFAQYADRLGSLIEAVNALGSLFYGTILGIFLTAFYLKRVRGTAVFWAALAAELVVLGCAQFLAISFLWYNLIGCLSVVALAWAFGRSFGRNFERSPLQNDSGNGAGGA